MNGLEIKRSALRRALKEHAREWGKHRQHDADLATSRRILIRLASEHLTKAEIARLLGVSRQAVTKSTTQGGGNG